MGIVLIFFRRSRLPPLVQHANGLSLLSRFGFEGRELPHEPSLTVRVVGQSLEVTLSDQILDALLHSLQVRKKVVQVNLRHSREGDDPSLNTSPEALKDPAEFHGTDLKDRLNLFEIIRHIQNERPRTADPLTEREPRTFYSEIFTPRSARQFV